MTARPHDPHVGLVVEGAGDLRALPLLLRAHLATAGEFREILGKPVPLNGRSKAFVPNGIEGYVATAGLRPGCVGVLVVLDGEGDRVCECGPKLKARVDSCVAVPVQIALADQDFEDWLFASAETLDLGLAFRSEQRGQPAIRAAIRPQSYTKPVWQPRLSARVDLELAVGRSPSLARMLQRFDQLRALLPPAV